MAGLARPAPTQSRPVARDLRATVPAQADLFGDLPPLDKWDIPAPTDHDRALGLLDGCLPDSVLVSGRTHLSRRSAG
ncbi:MAG: hypothetical protein ACRDTE_04545 [Pseudonocardiaceae bacterium]